MVATFSYYKRVSLKKLKSKNFFGIKYKAWIETQEEFELHKIQLGDEAHLLKSMFMQPVDSKSRRLLKVLLGWDSYGFTIEFGDSSIPFVPE